MRGIALFAHVVQGLQTHGMLLEPAAQGLGTDDLAQISASGAMRWCSIRQDHAAGLELAALDDVLFGRIHKAAFRAEHHQAVPETLQRQGRRPLRSSMAPTRRQPSVKTRQVGPSQGSMREEWYS